MILGLFLVPNVTDRALFATMTISTASRSFVSRFEVASGAWWTVSVALNAMATALIAGKLIHERRRLSKVLAKDHLVKYTTTTAILIETALPLSVVTFAFGAWGERLLSKFMVMP